ncbi:hypothetical protein BC826DRAFT_972643 [Russula brevipes]|nr:hypothetical protein BC826DRAFT_972643 [Russula brevipes]
MPAFGVLGALVAHLAPFSVLLRRDDMSMNTAPADVLLEIADHLSCPSEVLHLYLTSSRIADALTPALYSRIVLRGPAQCVRTLDMLYARPSRARHVRSLSVSPDSPGVARGRASRWGRSALPDGYAVSSAVRRVARHLEVLRHFAWDGEELPPYDDMWFALRILGGWFFIFFILRSCPRLKSISTTLGSILPSSNSHLFDFGDLHEFSLTFKSGFYWQNDGISRDEPVPGYHRLWDMLIKRCPNLEHLAIDGHSPHAPVDAHGLVRGRWPKLRSLLVGDVVLDWHVELNPALGRPFRTFLDAHRNLEALHLRSHAPSVAAPGVLAGLHADALAKVSTFSGALVQAQVLPARASLKTLRVPDALVLREGTPLNVSASLAALPALASLTIAFRLEQGYDNGTVLRAIVAACPHLRHLDFTIACRPSFTIVSAPSLSSRPSSPSPEECLFVWRPHHPGNVHAMRSSPRPAAHARPAHRALLRRRRPPHMRYPHRALEPTADVFELVFLARTGAQTLTGPAVRARAKFVLAADTHGLPLALHVVERRTCLLWPRESVRRATLEMRPAGTPGTRRTPLLALVLERSPAGEEARLLMFCVVLLAVVIWGCIKL